MHIRQEGIVPSSRLRDLDVYLVGAGGIGSLTATFLTKMGVRNLTVFDFDSVEEHNIPSQMFPLDAVGTPKVEALREHCERMSGTTIQIVNGKLLAEHELKGVVISAVDSMKSRKEIWDAVLRSPKVTTYIDGRMGGWAAHRICIDMLDHEMVEYYSTTLHTDEEGEDIPCSQRAIIFNTGAIGSMIAETVAKHAGGRPIVTHLAYDMLNSQLLTLRD